MESSPCTAPCSPPGASYQSLCERKPVAGQGPVYVSSGPVQPFVGIPPNLASYFWHPADHAYLFSAYLTRLQAYRELAQSSEDSRQSLIEDSKDVVEEVKKESIESESNGCSCEGPCRWQHLPHRKRRCAFPQESRSPSPRNIPTVTSPEPQESSNQTCPDSPAGSHDSGVWSTASSPVDFGRYTGSDLSIDDAPYRCFQCSKPFYSGSRLRAHQRRHASKDSGKYSCIVCGKSFVQRSSLTTHQRIHSGEKPFACPSCPERFGDFSTFTKHKRTHTGEKPYACSSCGRSFSQSGNMHRHVKAVHGLPPPQ